MFNTPISDYLDIVILHSLVIYLSILIDYTYDSPFSSEMHVLTFANSVPLKTQCVMRTNVILILNETP